MIHIRYILDKSLDVLGHDEPLGEFHVYQGAVPSMMDTVIIYSSVFLVSGIMWMIGAPMYDEYSMSQLPPEAMSPRHGDLHVVAVTLQYQRDMT